MSQWIDRINTHPVWNELKSLGLAIDQASAREANDIAVVDGLERIRTVLTFCGKRLAATDPVLMEPRALTGLASHLTPARSEIEAFVSDGIAAHIETANARADEVLVALQPILAPIAADDLTVINASISSYRTTLQKYLQEALDKQGKLKAASDANEVKISALETTLKAEQQRLATLVLEHQTQFSTAQDKRASDFSAALTEQQTKYASTAAEQLTQFSKDQDARSTDYAGTQLANQEKFAALIADYTQKLKDQDRDFAEKLDTAANGHEADLDLLRTGYEDSAKEILGQINVYKNDVEKLVGVIGNLGVTSGYQKVANLARSMLFLWQFITVVALGGLIFIAYQMAFPPTKFMSTAIEAPQTASSTVSPSIPKSLDKTVPFESPMATIQAASTPVSDSAFYQGLATRIFLSITFGIFAAYASRQASHFLEMERKNRKLALELEALGPYIAPLDKEKQDEFRIKIGDRSFGMNDNDLNPSKTADPVTPYDVFNPKELGEFAASIAKGMK
jgi:hypothetical protein